MGFSSAECASFFQENGYYVYENALSIDEVEELRQETTRICRGDAGKVRGLEATEGLATEEMLRR